MRRWLVMLILLPAMALLAAACGDDASSSAADGELFNDADVAFVQGMIPHHEQAVEMAELALDPTAGSSQKVRDLAKRIKAAQGPEIELMTRWLDSWGQPMTMDASGGHEMSSAEGMMSEGEMIGLRRAKGASFDAMFLEMMVLHHEGAIAMAETVKDEGADPAVQALADEIIKAQRAEIDEMGEILAR